MQRLRGRAGRRADAVEPEPAGGWLRSIDGVVDLAAAPPPEPVALPLGARGGASPSPTGRRPGPAARLARRPSARRRCAGPTTATRELFAVLRDGNARSWRFLEVTGVLERALPELAEALRRRQADPFELDPRPALPLLAGGGLRDVVGHRPTGAPELAAARAPGVAAAGRAHPRRRGATDRRRWPSPAGSCSASTSAPPPSRRSPSWSATGAAAGGAIRRLDALDEERVFALATHLDRPERARALYLLTLGEWRPRPPRSGPGRRAPSTGCSRCSNSPS